MLYGSNRSFELSVHQFIKLNFLSSQYSFFFSEFFYEKVKHTSFLKKKIFILLKSKN